MQQFTIQSDKIRDKLNNLLPSQNVGGIGVELTGSTQVIPIVDLTEVAEGSDIRQDLQTSLSLTSVTSFSVVNQTTTLINTTGYFRVFGSFSSQQRNPGGSITFRLTDGTTTKNLFVISMKSIATDSTYVGQYDFNVFLGAGESLVCVSSNTTDTATGCTRQIADLSGNLVNP